MKRDNPLLSALSAACYVGALVGCGHSHTRGEEQDEQNRVTQLRATEMGQPIRVSAVDNDLNDRARRLVEVFSQRAVESFDLAGTAPAEGFGDTRSIRPLPDSPHVLVTYRSRQDDLRIQNTLLESDFEGALLHPRLSESDAYVSFMQYLRFLEDAELLSIDQLDLNGIRVGRTEHFAGMNDELSSPETVDYRFRVRRQLGGMQIRNSLVRIAVARSGDVSSIRILRGAQRLELVKGEEIPLARSHCDARFGKDFAGAQIEDDGLGYFLPEDVKTGEKIEPRCYYSFVHVFDVGGVKTTSRRMDVRYPLLSEDPPEVLGGPTVGAEDPSDIRPN